MTRSSMVRLPDEAAKKVEQYGKEHGLAFATALRCMIIDHLKETYPDLMKGAPEEIITLGSRGRENSTPSGLR